MVLIDDEHCRVMSENAWPAVLVGDKCYTDSIQQGIMFVATISTSFEQPRNADSPTDSIAGARRA